MNSIYPIQNHPPSKIATGTSNRKSKQKKVFFADADVEDGGPKPKRKKLADLIGARSPVVTRGRKK